jgi:hypothetical protein
MSLPTSHQYFWGQARILSDPYLPGNGKNAILAGCPGIENLSFSTNRWFIKRKRSSVLLDVRETFQHSNAPSPVLAPRKHKNITAKTNIELKKVKA